MNDHWVEKEMYNMDLGDKRLEKRCKKILGCFAQAPLSPINQACKNWAETKAAYRFFQNDKIKYQEITKAHHRATTQRANNTQKILAVQDTTYCTYATHPATQGLCPISRIKNRKGKDISTMGLLVHSTLILNDNGLPVGVGNQKIFSTVKKKSKKNSCKWIEALEQTVAQFPDQRENIITICDREADMYDLFIKAHQLNTQLLVRACQNRKVNKSSTYSKKTGEKFWSLLENKKPQGEIVIEVPRRKNQQPRKAVCTIKFTEVTISPPLAHPQRNTKDRLCPDFPNAESAIYSIK